jgi:indole-3-glycerol phosphate synthase
VDILSVIIAAKKERLVAAMALKPLAHLRDEALNTRGTAPPHALVTALKQTARLNIIAEFKRRSPSKGLILEDADPVAIVSGYELGGAAAISVLTEQDHFAGSLADLASVRSITTLPILRKDFIFSEYQVYESAAAGADALLLIVAALTDDLLVGLRCLAEDEFGLDALVEVHTGEEMKRALAAGAKVIGINNRDLRTFEVSLATSERLASGAPDEVILISESGLNTASDLRRLAAQGFKGFLIGETLMRAADPEQALRSLVGEGE